MGFIATKIYYYDSNTNTIVDFWNGKIVSDNLQQLGMTLQYTQKGYTIEGDKIGRILHNKFKAIYEINENKIISKIKK